MGGLLSDQILERVTEDVMEGGRAEWLRLAQENLNTSAAEYISGIQPVETQHGVVSIALVGALSNMVENGSEPYEMRAVLLKGKKSRVIRFFHSGPMARGDQSGTPLGRQFAPKTTRSHSQGRRLSTLQEATVLGERVYRAATRQTARGLPAPGGLAPRLRASHATDPFAGLVNEGGRMKTFRTITMDPEKWRHPGIEARRLVEGVQSYVEDVFPAALESFIGRVFG